ncbi:MAG: DNA methyltransferase [Armatimonadota bacterium]
MENKKSKKLKYSDIDLSCWKDYEDIRTDSLWIYNQRDKSNGHKFEYHGNFIPQIASQMFRRYTKSGEVIVDWFLGAGTSAIEALSLDRKLIGIDLKDELINQVNDRISQHSQKDNIKLICGDSTKKATKVKVQKYLDEMGCKQAHFAVLHPPYADIIKFSNKKNDLSNCISTDDFLDMFEKVAQNAYDLLEKGRFACLVIGDKYENQQLDPLGFKCMQRMNDVGFKTKSIIVKNIEGNEKAKGKDNNLWRYRALAGGFYIFKHEYVMVFFK